MQSSKVINPINLKKPKKDWGGFFLLLPIAVFIIMFSYVPLAGWYFSRDYGEWFLIGGVILGALVGGGLALTGSLSGVFAKKYISSRNEGKKK